MTFLEQSQQAWEEFAVAYDRAITPYSMKAGQEALRLAGVEPGDRLLDVASGGGALSIPAALLGASVLAVDYSQAMVDLLNHKASESGLANLEARCMDGTALELEDDGFDFACSVLGVMLFPDRARGLAEMARVVRPGGKGVMVVFGPPERVQTVSIFIQALAQAVPGFVPPRDSPLFCLQDPEVLKSEMELAGFREIEVTVYEVAVEVDSPDQLWQMILSGAPAIAGLVRNLSEEQQAATRRALSELLRSQSQSSGSNVLPMQFNIGVGVKV